MTTYCQNGTITKACDFNKAMHCLSFSLIKKQAEITSNHDDRAEVAINMGKQQCKTTVIPSIVYGDR